MSKKIISIAIIYCSLLYYGMTFSQSTTLPIQQPPASKSICFGPLGPAPCEVVQQQIFAQQQARQFQLLSCPRYPSGMSNNAENLVLSALENLGRLPTADYQLRVFQTTRYLASILNQNDLLYLNAMLIAAYCNSLNFQSDVPLQTKEAWLQQFANDVISVGQNPQDVLKKQAEKDAIAHAKGNNGGPGVDALFGNPTSGAVPQIANRDKTPKIDRLQANTPVQFVPPPPAKEEGRIYPVWYGTNRKPLDAKDEKIGYSNKRDSGKIHYGKCNVIIPKDHKFGSVGPIWYMRWSRADAPLSVQPPLPLTKDEFFNDMRKALTADTNSRSVLVYIHGFNVDFNEAAIRAGQIGFDLKVPGVTAFFSWPSKGELSPGGYASDLSNIEASEDQIADFLISIHKEVMADRIHIVAHSMGNYGLIRALNGATAQASLRGGVKFGQIFLAAPDVDADLFKRLAVVYPTVSERTTLYVSSKDRALEASSWLREYNRAGYTPPISVLSGIDTIEVSKIDLTLLGHGYFGDAASVLHDMHNLIKHNDSPINRPRLNKVLTNEGQPYWQIQ